MNTTTTAALNIKPTKLTNAVAIEIVGMNKWYGEFHVLRDINLTRAAAASASSSAVRRGRASRP